jgi:hypothetical protein
MHAAVHGCAGGVAQVVTQLQPQPRPTLADVGDLDAEVLPEPVLIGAIAGGGEQVFGQGAYLTVAAAG